MLNIIRTGCTGKQAGMERLYGRGKVIDFAKAALRCENVRDQPLPILLLVGPRGSGGSALLARLWQEFGDDGPCVRLDMLNAEEVADVTLIAMQGLLRHVWGVRQLRFPRLRLAVKALSFADAGGINSRAAFETYMRKGGRTAKASSTLRDWTDRVSPLLLSPDQQLLAKIVSRLLGWLLSGIDHQRDQAILRWFAEESDVAGSGGFDPLWRLHQWQRETDGTKRYRADKTMCDAFLTDMRTDYANTGFRHDSRTRNPGLLLDNVDSRLGGRLLELLDECRRKSRNSNQPADPLLVVAVQRGLPSDRVDAPVIEAVQDDLDFAKWLRTAAAAERSALWCPVYLSALSNNDVIDMTPSRVLGPSDRVHRDADFIRSLTGGHPEATERLATVLAAMDTPADPRLVLDQHMSPEMRSQWDAGGPDTTVGDHLLKRAFADTLQTLPDGGIDPDGNELLDAMAAGAATPGFRLGACQAVLDFCEWKGATAVAARDRLTEAMWRAEPPQDHSGSPVTPAGAEERPAGNLHPLAGLLLRHWLARDPAKWANVHEGYVSHYSGKDDVALRYRHKLALVTAKAGWEDSRPTVGNTSTASADSGQLLEIVTFLGREWDSDSGEEPESVRQRTRDWLHVLDTVADAPNRLRTTHHPEAFVRALAGPVAPGSRHQVFARLVVSRWLFNDRLFDPARRLARVIADEYHLLAQLPGGDGDILLEEEARYRKIQRKWED